MDEEIKQVKEQKNLEDMLKRYLESQKELVEMIVHLFSRFESPLIKKLLEYT